MASAKVIRTIIGIIGTVISSLISLSQLPRFIHIYKKKSVEDYIPTRHLALVIIHGLWVLYGLPLFHKDGILVTTSNGIGCLIEVIYLVVFLIYCSDESCRSNTWFSLASGIPLVVVFLYATSLTGSASLSTLHITIGVICDVLTTGVDIKIAVTYEDVPVWFYLAKFINAGVWLAYSLFYQLDIFVLISSGLGMLLCASQLIFCSNQPSKATLGSDEESGCTPAVDVRWCCVRV